ncbi:SWIM-type [Hexamita inflata]|nr:SWIM-type [Hexamita inflata]
MTKSINKIIDIVDSVPKFIIHEAKNAEQYEIFFNETALQYDICLPNDSLGDYKYDICVSFKQQVVSNKDAQFYCSCKLNQLTQLPCSHIIKMFCFNNNIPVQQFLPQYFTSWIPTRYSVETLRKQLSIFQYKEISVPLHATNQTLNQKQDQFQIDINSDGEGLNLQLVTLNATFKQSEPEQSNLQFLDSPSESSISNISESCSEGPQKIVLSEERIQLLSKIETLVQEIGNNPNIIDLELQRIIESLTAVQQKTTFINPNPVGNQPGSAKRVKSTQEMILYNYRKAREKFVQ